MDARIKAVEGWGGEVQLRFYYLDSGAASRIRIDGISLVLVIFLKLFYLSLVPLNIHLDWIKNYS